MLGPAEWSLLSVCYLLGTVYSAIIFGDSNWKTVGKCLTWPISLPVLFVTMFIERFDKDEVGLRK